MAGANKTAARTEDDVLEDVTTDESACVAEGGTIGAPPDTSSDGHDAVFGAEDEPE